MQASGRGSGVSRKDFACRQGQCGAFWEKTFGDGFSPGPHAKALKACTKEDPSVGVYGIVQRLKDGFAQDVGRKGAWDWPGKFKLQKKPCASAGKIAGECAKYVKAGRLCKRSRTVKRLVSPARPARRRKRRVFTAGKKGAALFRALRPPEGDIAIRGKLAPHECAGIKWTAESAWAVIGYPPPCIPGFNPIEAALSKLEGFIKNKAARTFEPPQDA